MSDFKLRVSKFRFMRTKAIEYAKLWYLRRNPNYYSYSSDCANFVSQCLYAGFVPMVKKVFGWFSSKILIPPRKNKFGQVQKSIIQWNISPSWRLADTQYRTIKKSKLANKSFVIKSKSDIKTKLKKYTVQKGDLLYFDFENDKKINHASIISSVTKNSIKYSAHTSSRFDKNVKTAFDSYDNLRLYVITIKDSWIPMEWL